MILAMSGCGALVEEGENWVGISPGSSSASVGLCMASSATPFLCSYIHGKRYSRLLKEVSCSPVYDKKEIEGKKNIFRCA